jgi:hypothetical protein
MLPSQPVVDLRDTRTPLGDVLMQRLAHADGVATRADDVPADEGAFIIHRSLPRLTAGSIPARHHASRGVVSSPSPGAVRNARNRLPNSVIVGAICSGDGLSIAVGLILLSAKPCE